MQRISSVEQSSMQTHSEQERSSVWISEGVRRKVTEVLHFASIGVVATGWLAVAYSMSEWITFMFTAGGMISFIGEIYGTVMIVQPIAGLLATCVGSFVEQKIRPLLTTPIRPYERLEPLFFTGFLVNLVGSIALGVYAMFSGISLENRDDPLTVVTIFLFVSNFTMAFIVEVLFHGSFTKNHGKDCFCLGCVCD